MTQLFSRKFWIILISSCCVGTGIAIACAGDWGEEYGVSNFSPEIITDSSGNPFFYSNLFYYQINYENDQHTRFDSTNTDEWTGFFKNQINRNELKYVLESASAASVDSAYNYITAKSKAIPASMQSFALLQQKNNKQLLAFFDYLRLAEKCGIFALNDIPDAWGTDSSAKKTKHYNVTALSDDIKNGLQKTTDPFLKERYWFQLIRLYFFNDGLQKAVDLFKTAEKDMPHNTMYYRSMGYAAGAFYKLKNYSMANYYYSRVYANCDLLKTSAHYSFHPQEEKDWNATLALCSNSDEKAVLWQMLGIFYADEQRSIKEIYQLNPASNKMELLLLRAVNKYEQKFGQHNGLSIDMPLDTAAIRTLPALVIKIATAGNTAKPWVWQMAAGYLNTLDQKYVSASGWYAKAEKTMPGKKNVQAQLRLLKLINTIGQAKRIDAKFEKEVLGDLVWLSRLDPKTIPDLRYADAFAWAKQTMAEKYGQQKDWVKSECFTSNASFYADNKNVEALKVFLNKKEKTAYEKLCASLCVKKPDDLLEFQAIQLTFSDSLAAAIEKMEKAGAGAGATLAGNPFNGKIKDCHDCDHEAPQKIKYTKISLLKKLKELKDKISTGDDSYNNAMLLANAYYNITQYGNARFFYECKVLGEGHSDPYSIDSVFRKMLTSMNIASSYYNLCLQNAATDEQRAKCQYMLAKCERNQWYNDGIYGKAENQYNPPDNSPDFIAWDGFKALEKYSNTQYYKDVIKECGYFKTYAAKAK